MFTNTSSMLEERHTPRYLNFCLAFEHQGKLLGIVTDFSLNGLRLTIPRHFSSQASFSLTLRREDAEPPKQVTLKVETVWRKEKNAQFDEIGLKIIEIDSEEDYGEFATHCQQNPPNGLFSAEHPATKFFKRLNSP